MFHLYLAPGFVFFVGSERILDMQAIEGWLADAGLRKVLVLEVLDHCAFGLWNAA